MQTDVLRTCADVAQHPTGYDECHSLSQRVPRDTVEYRVGISHGDVHSVVLEQCNGQESSLNIAVQVKWLDRQIEASDYLTPNHRNHVYLVNFVKHRRSSVNHAQPYRGVPNYEYYLHLMCLVQVITRIKHVILRPVTRSSLASFSLLFFSFFVQIWPAFIIQISWFCFPQSIIVNLRSKAFRRYFRVHRCARFFDLSYRYVQRGPSSDSASLCIFQDFAWFGSPKEPVDCF